MTEGLIHCLSPEFLEFANPELRVITDLSFLSQKFIALKGRIDPNSALVPVLTSPPAVFVSPTTNTFVNSTGQGFLRVPKMERFPMYKFNAEKQLEVGDSRLVVEEYNLFRYGDFLFTIDLFDFHKLALLEPKVFSDAPFFGKNESARIKRYAAEAFEMINHKRVFYQDAKVLGNLSPNLVVSAAPSYEVGHCWLTACIYFSGDMNFEN